MGDEGLIAAVIDSGPIIHLTEIGCLSLLRIFSALHIPDAVWHETVEQGRVLQEDLLRVNRINRHALSPTAINQFTTEKGFKKLDDGERECLYLCKQINVSLILTDDLAVRDAANLLNISPVGSLGIGVKAYKSGQISLSEAERIINALYDISSLFVTRAIVEIAIEELYKRFPHE